MSSPQNPDPVPGFPTPAQSWPGSGFTNAPTASSTTAEKVEATRGQFIELILQQVVLALTNLFLPGGLGSAFSQLKNWAEVLLPEQILEPLSQLVTLLVAILAPFPIIGDVVEDLASAFGLLQDKSDNAQATADHANVAVAQLEAKLAAGEVPNGVHFSDTFDRTGGDLGPNYSQGATGPAGGQLSTDGANAVLNPTGNGVTTDFARITTELFTDYQGFQVIQGEAVVNVLSPAQISGGLRCDATKSNYLAFRIHHGSVEVGKVVGGGWTSLASVPQGNEAGDRWTLKAGTSTDIRELVLYRNSSKLITVLDDSGPLSLVGASNRFPMLVEKSAQIFVPPFLTQSVPGPKIQSVEAYDRLPTDV